MRGVRFCFFLLLMELEGGQQSLLPMLMTSGRVPLTQHLRPEDGSGSSQSATAQNRGAVR